MWVGAPGGLVQDLVSFRWWVGWDGWVIAGGRWSRVGCGCSMYVCMYSSKAGGLLGWIGGFWARAIGIRREIGIRKSNRNRKGNRKGIISRKGKGRGEGRGKEQRGRAKRW